MYSLTLLVKSNLEEKDRKEVLDSIKEKFGKVIKEDLWGVRTLAYPIKHQTQAFYAHYEFESEPVSIPVLDRSVKLNEDVIRYILLKNEVIKKQPKKVVAKEVEKTESIEAEVSVSEEVKQSLRSDDLKEETEEKPKKIKRVIKKKV